MWKPLFTILIALLAFMFSAPIQKQFLNLTTRFYSHTAKMPLAPLIALSHGGGPMPLLNDPAHKSIIHSLTKRVPSILKLNTPDAPKAIVLVTAHWNTKTPRISSSSSHSLLYDYGGFPPETYNLNYPASGSPEVAEKVRKQFEDAGLNPVMDPSRGWDHGVFVPMLLIDPKGTIPIVQVSVLESEDPSQHLKMGAALHALRAQNIAIIGSGFASFHNLRIMFPLMRSVPGQPPSAKEQEIRAKSAAFNRDLTKAVLEDGRKVREEGVKDWRKFEGAWDMHPEGGGEHFLPLVVCVGAVGEEEKGRVYRDEFVGVDILTYYWGVEEVE